MVTGQRVPRRLFTPSSRPEWIIATWCWRTEVCDRQTARCTERGGTSRQVWPWTVADSACWLALARCGRSGSVQARRYSPSVSTQESAEVPGRLLRHCLRHCWSSETAFSTSSPAGRATSSTQYPRPLSIFCSPDQSSGTRFQTSWEVTLKTVVLGSHRRHCFRVSTSVPSALEVYLYTTIALYKLTFYLLT